MSFTTDIKNEISNLNYSKTESIAELSAIFNIGINIEKNKATLQLENIAITRRIYKLIKRIYNIEVKLETINTQALRKRKAIVISIEENIKQILNDLSIIDEAGKRLYTPKEFILNADEEKISYIRGAFIICGSINDPKTSRYHAEFTIENKKTAEFLDKLLNNLNCNSKMLKRDKNYMVYIKESEKISDILRMMNATNSLLYYEDIRIYRDYKNMNNRYNNCEQANADKVIQTALAQMNMIQKLKKIKDFDLLNEKIKEVCIYREKYPETSMDELSNIISLETGNKITKSGINHRFRKIKEILNKNNY